MATRAGFVTVQSSLFDHMRQHCQSCQGFNLSFEDLPDGRVATATSKRHKVTYKSSKKSRALDRFINHAPIGNKWRKRQCELGLVTVENYENVVRSLFCRSNVSFKGTHREQNREAESELVVVVGKRLANLTKAALDNLHLQRSFAYFQVLLLLSYCEFLLKKGISVDVVDELVQTITDVRERDRKELLKTIPWIHKLINALVCRGWTIFRATELFFINALSPTDLMRIRDDASYDFILEQLSVDPAVMWNFDDCLTPQYTIPGLIASLLDSVGISDEVRLAAIYDTLGYDLPDCHLTTEDIYVVQPVQKTPASPRSLQFAISTQRSFTMDDIQGEGSFGACTELQNTISNIARPLLLLICAVGALPRIMIDRAALLQTRWNEDGDHYKIDPQKASFDDSLKNLFSDPSQLHLVLDHLLSSAAVKVERVDDVEIICTSTPACSHSYESLTYWMEQVLRFFCHIFPREPTDLPVPEKKQVLAVFDVVLGFYTTSGKEIPSDDEVIETLLAVSKCGPLSSQHRILSLLDPLLKRTRSAPHLRAEAVYQQSVLFRLKGDIASSNRLLEEFLDHTDIAVRLKTHHVIGQLHLSRATNHAYKFEFYLANKEAQLWTPLDSNVTEKKFDVMWNQIYSAGKILRGQGQFEFACELYNKCLETPSLRDSKKRLVLSHLVDTYVEIHYLRRDALHPPHAENLLDTASGMIRMEIERLRLHQPRSKGFRRLLLSLSEVEIRRNQLVAAERLLQEVFSIYETLVEPDIVDRLGHIRASIALARISPLDEAESYWLSALSLGRKYYPLEEEVFTVAIIHLFLCITRLQLNDFQGGRAAFDYAARICLTNSPQYLIPGAGTYLFEEAQDRIQSLVGWKFPRQE